MPLANTPQSYGAVARTLHWLTALLILSAIPLGLVAADLPFATDAELARKAWLFSLHKTVGVAAFAVALLRILWALTQPRPVAIHPDRRWENRLAELVHWSLYLALVAVPLTGWIQHAATTGFAPILWPFGQDLPLVPKSEALARLMGGLHEVFGKVLIASVLLHVAGAAKHAVIDRDGTLSRMLRGTPAPERLAAGQGAAGKSGAGQGAAGRHGRGPALAALAIYAAGAGAVVALNGAAAPGGGRVTEAVASAPSSAPEAVPAPAAPDAWVIEAGSIDFTFRQMGAMVRGSFGAFTTDLRFDPQGGTGSVDVTMDVLSMTVGSVTAQAREAAYFDAAAHPTARFSAAIRPEGDGFVADGTLTLKGRAVPVALPFTLALDGGRATARGKVILDRRDFGIGEGQNDDDTLGFAVEVEVSLTARQPG